MDGSNESAKWIHVLMKKIELSTLLISTSSCMWWNAWYAMDNNHLLIYILKILGMPDDMNKPAMSSVGFYHASSFNPVHFNSFNRIDTHTHTCVCCKKIELAVYTYYVQHVVTIYLLLYGAGLIYLDPFLRNAISMAWRNHKRCLTPPEQNDCGSVWFRTLLAYTEGLYRGLYSSSWRRRQNNYSFFFEGH